MPRPKNLSQRYQDVTGQRFGRLVAIQYEYTDRWKGAVWLFKCDCGNDIVAKLSNAKARSDKLVSCGCRLVEVNMSEQHRLITVKHDMHDSKEYMAWSRAKDRCTNPNYAQFKDYGLRGIRFHDAWVNDFSAFYNHVGPCPPGHSLDRIKVNGNYEPGNIRWATPAEQSQNTTVTRLSVDKVIAIRASNATNKELAAKYSVSKSTVQAARTKQTWKNVG